MRRKVPGLFVLYAPLAELAIRACLRSMFIRVRIPGGVPDLLRERMRLRLLFYNLDVAKTSPPRVLADADRMRGGVTWVPVNSGRERQSSLAVAQRPARVVRDDEDAGSTPAGETNRFPSSSADQRARGYDPRGRGFESLPGCQSWRRNSEERVPACRAGGRGFKSRRRRQYSGA